MDKCTVGSLTKSASLGYEPPRIGTAGVPGGHQDASEAVASIRCMREEPVVQEQWVNKKADIHNFAAV